METLKTFNLKYFFKIKVKIEEMVVLPDPCPPAKPIIKGLFLLTLFDIQKQTGIKKDLIIFSLFLNLSFFVSCEEINLKQSFFTLLKQSLTDHMKNYFF